MVGGKTDGRGSGDFGDDRDAKMSLWRRQTDLSLSLLSPLRLL